MLARHVHFSTLQQCYRWYKLLSTSECKFLANHYNSSSCPAGSTQIPGNVLRQPRRLSDSRFQSPVIMFQLQQWALLTFTVPYKLSKRLRLQLRRLVYKKLEAHVCKYCNFGPIDSDGRKSCLYRFCSFCKEFTVTYSRDTYGILFWRKDANSDGFVDITDFSFSNSQNFMIQLAVFPLV